MVITILCNRKTFNVLVIYVNWGDMDAKNVTGFS